MRRVLYCGLVLSCAALAVEVSGPAGAAEVLRSGGGVSSVTSGLAQGSNEGPLIESDRLIYNKHTRLAIHSGNVVFRWNDLRLESERLVVQYRVDPRMKFNAAKPHISCFKFQGGARISTAKARGSAGEIVWSAETRNWTFRSNVELLHETGLRTGQALVLDGKTGYVWSGGADADCDEVNGSSRG
jgi:lipopolysaccharide export system protein LptA